jgi:hypothetical protein
MRNGHFVSRCSHFIIYSVEAKNIDAVVKAFGPCMALRIANMPTLIRVPRSYKSRGHSRRSNILQSPGDGGF